MSIDYAEFIARKSEAVAATGTEVDPSNLNPMLHPWQAEIVAWALRVGCAAIWADTGLGKTFMQVEWLYHASGFRSGGYGLVVAPLAVCHQTVTEAAKLGIMVEYVRRPTSITGPGIYITNYEQVEQFDPSRFRAVVLDEASILKNETGATRTMLIRHFADVPYRLACTATPAPNDPEELTSQAEFLGHMTRTHMLAAYFVHDQNGWRLKGHAHRPMMEWMASWAVALRRPSDIGYPDDGYDLPGLNIVPELVHVDLSSDDQLFRTELGGVSGRAHVRKETLAARVDRAASLVQSEPDEPWLLWCGLNAEANALAKAIPNAVNVHGALTPDQKADYLLGFARGNFQIMITKPSIASQGLNYQHCARMAFVGMSDSYEQYYQAIRRCYRYGQKRVVDAHIILSELESQIAANVARKEREASRITTELITEMRRAQTIGRTAA